MPIMNTVIQGGGTTPTGTKNITANGVYDVTDFASADVQVPTTAPEYYLKKDVVNGTMSNASATAINLNNVTDLSTGVLAYAYHYANLPANTVFDMSSITRVSQEACYKMCAHASGVVSLNLSGLTEITLPQVFEYAFTYCSTLASADFSSLTTITGQYSCKDFFPYCTALATVDLSNLKAIDGDSCCKYMFQSCTSLTSIDLSSLSRIRGSQACQYMFYNCTGLTSANLSGLKSITGSANNTCQNMFRGCTGLTGVNLSNLIELTSPSAFNAMFFGCSNLSSVDLSRLTKLGSSGTLASTFSSTALTELRFPSLAYTQTNINGAFNSTLGGVTGCTVHFPSDWETTMASYSNITNGLGGTNTVVLFDLPPVTSLDLSYITEFDVWGLSGFCRNNYFPNITSADLSGLTSISYTNACSGMFDGCTVLTSVDLSSLTTISGENACQNMFQGCTGLTSIDLSSLTTISGYLSAIGMFKGCTSLASVDLSALTTITETTSPLETMFQGCTGLTSVSFNSLTQVLGSYWCSSMFKDCTGLTSISFPALTSSSFGTRNKTQFNNLVQNVTGCTIHFPSNLDPQGGSTVISSLTGYPNFGGTNTVLAFDLPATE